MVKGFIGLLFLLIGIGMAGFGLNTIGSAERDDGGSDYSCTASSDGKSSCVYDNASPTATMASLTKGLSFVIIGAAGIAGGLALIAGGRSGEAQSVTIVEPPRPITFNAPTPGLMQPDLRLQPPNDPPFGQFRG